MIINITKREKGTKRYSIQIKLIFLDNFYTQKDNPEEMTVGRNRSTISPDTPVADVAGDGFQIVGAGRRRGDLSISVRFFRLKGKASR